MNITSQMESNNIKVTPHYNSLDIFYRNESRNDVTYVMKCVNVSIGLPLTLVAIYSLYSQVQNNNVAPIFIINLLISDVIQFCYMIFLVVKPEAVNIYRIFYCIYVFGLLPSVCFMVCIALERYLVIAWPLWYRFRRNIKSALVVCVVVWTLPLVYVLPYYFRAKFWILKSILGVFYLFPFPLLIFFLGGSLKSLSAAISLSSDEKRRIVGILVLVLLIYTLLFLPTIIWFLVEETRDYDTLRDLRLILLKMSPLADLILYFFIRKGPIDKLLASLCFCRMHSDDDNISLSV